MIKKGVVIANLLLITLAAYLGVDLFYGMVTARFSMNAVSAAPGIRQSVPDRPVVTRKPVSAYSAIAERNLFKATKSEMAAQPEIDVTSLKKTDLALTLVGTISGEGANSYAIIERTRERQQDLYKVGDTVENATVKLILRKRVVLTVNGVDEVLEMTDALFAEDAGRARFNPAAAGRRESGLDRAASVRNVTLDRSEMESAFNNVNDLMRSVRIRPHFTDGQPDGLSLESVAPDSIFQEMGLQSKDVIVGVNGKKISTVDDCMEVYKSLSDASAVVLEVNRGGQRELIHYNVQ